MPSPFARVRLGATVAGAFVGGLLCAAALDLTPFGYAQGTASRPTITARPGADVGSTGFITIAERVTPAVVSIESQRDPRAGGQQQQQRQRRNLPPGMEEFFEQFEPRQRGPQESSGSGFIVTKDGYILTNNHVVEGADRVTVTLPDRRVFRAKVIGRDPTTDVAVIKIDGSSDFPTIPFGDDTALRIGEWVLAIGNPLGLDFTVTAGIVSAKGRGGRELASLYRNNYAITDFIQTDAAINPGNSGGPLVNARGEVIGVNSAIASPTGYYSGYGFAIPITLARDVMDDIVQHGRVRRPVLGIAINDVTSEDAGVAGLKTISGVLVTAFNGDDSPARRAGIEVNDVVVAIDGKTVDRVSTLQRIVRAHEPGETVTVDAMRYGTKKTFRVKLTEAPAEEQLASAATENDAGRGGSASAGKLGIAVEPVSADLAREAGLTDAQRGLRVVDVTPGGPSYAKLAENGDVILEVLHPARRPVRSVTDLQQALSGVKGGEFVSLNVYNIGLKQTRVVNLRIGE
jgi:serine protease Do